jgi:hypothetical protein
MEYEKEKQNEIEKEIKEKYDGKEINLDVLKDIAAEKQIKMKELEKVTTK